MKIVEERVTMPMDILDVVLDLVRECPTVTTVMFSDWHPSEPKNITGNYFPELALVKIYLGGVMTMGIKLMQQGMALHAGVWLALLYTLYHEFAHVKQVQENPVLAKLLVVPQPFELAAAEGAWEGLASDLASEPCNPPRIERMGWLGDEILKLMNAVLPSVPDAVRDIIDMNGSNLAGRAINLLMNKYDSPDEIIRWLKTVEAGMVGVQKDKVGYLTFSECIGALNLNEGGSL